MPLKQTVIALIFYCTALNAELHENQCNPDSTDERCLARIAFELNQKGDLSLSLQAFKRAARYGSAFSYWNLAGFSPEPEKQRLESIARAMHYNDAVISYRAENLAAEVRDEVWFNEAFGMGLSVRQGHVLAAVVLGNFALISGNQDRLAVAYFWLTFAQTGLKICGGPPSVRSLVQSMMHRVSQKLQDEIKKRRLRGDVEQRYQALQAWCDQSTKNSLKLRDHDPDPR